MNAPDKAAFTAQDMKVLRLLALTLGVVTIGECLLARNPTMVAVVIALNVLTMIACPLVIYLLRRARLRPTAKD